MKRLNFFKVKIKKKIIAENWFEVGYDQEN